MKNILIVIDMQNGFARYEQTIRLSKKIGKLLETQVFDVVIGTRFFNANNSMYEKMFNWSRLKTNEERAIPNELLKNMDYIEDKYIYNCVNTNFIQKICQLNDGDYPERVFIVGADTDCCVLTIATALFENNIRPIVLTNYCDSNGGPESHAAGIICLKRLVGEKQLVEGEISTKEDIDKIV